MDEHEANLIKLEGKTALEIAITVLVSLTILLVVSTIALRIYFWLS